MESAKWGSRGRLLSLNRGKCDGNGIDGADFDAVITACAFIPMADTQHVDARFLRIAFLPFLDLYRANREHGLTAGLQALLAVEGGGAFLMIDLNHGESWC